MDHHDCHVFSCKTTKLLLCRAENLAWAAEMRDTSVDVLLLSIAAESRLLKYRQMLARDISVHFW